MNLDHLEAISLVQQTAYHLEPQDYDAVEIVVVPAFTALRSIQTLIEGDRLPMGLGAQDTHWEESGAFTGAVSPRMLAKLKVRYVVCGHSERRTLFGEDDETAVVVVATWAFCFVMTFIIFKAVDGTIGMAASPGDEDRGMDISEHSETGYQW